MRIPLFVFSTRFVLLSVLLAAMVLHALILGIFGGVEALTPTTRQNPLDVVEKTCLKSKNDVKYYSYFLKEGEHRSDQRSQNSAIHYFPYLRVSTCQLLVGVRFYYPWRRQSDAGFTFL